MIIAVGILTILVVVLGIMAYNVNNAKSQLEKENIKLRAQIQYEKESKPKLEQEYEARFKLLANEILASHTAQFKESSKASISDVLRPIQKDLTDFKKAVDDNSKAQSVDIKTLERHIQDLTKLNNDIGNEARNLAKALRSNSNVQGRWGETILLTILERAGLTKGLHYTYQEVLESSGSKRLRTDVVINYPDDRCLIIDSKVSLTAYTDYVNAKTPPEQEKYGKEHIQSLKSHLKELELAKYQDNLRGKNLEFVLMFIPNEGAYATAMELDYTLWQEAYDKRIIILSPTHLLSMVKMIEEIWRNHLQVQNDQRIVKAATALYQKFNNFLQDMLNVKQSLDRAQKAYDQATIKLSGKGGLIRKAENLRKMGISSSSQLPAQFTDYLDDDNDDNDVDSTENIPGE